MESLRDIATALLNHLDENERKELFSMHFDTVETLVVENAENNSTGLQRLMSKLVYGMTSREKRSLLDVLSENMLVGEYLGDWDGADLVEHVLDNHLGETIDELFDNNMETVVRSLNDERRKELLSYISNNNKPIIRLHADGSATIKEFTIPASHIINE